MLSIGKLAVGQEGYYLGKVAEGVEDYYVGGGEAAGRWVGAGARELGLSGDVTAEQLRAMLGGNNPRTNTTLRSDSRTQGPGFDFTFSAPKSVSLLWAFGDEATRAAVVKAHEHAVDSALGYLEQNASFARRGAGGRDFVKAPTMLAAAYRHRTSRAGDPQIHTHVLVAKLVKAEDGRWSAPHSPSLYSNAKAAGYLYQAELRDQLSRELGLSFGEVHKGSAPIDGIELAAEAEFSRRRAEIEAAQELGGTGSKASLQASALETRRAKEYDVEPGALEQDWVRRGKKLGLTPKDISRLVRTPPERELPSVKVKKLTRELTATTSHFQRRDVIMALCAHAPQGAKIADLEKACDRILDHSSVVPIGEVAWGGVYSTQELVNLEKKFLDATAHGRNTGRAIASPGRVDHVLTSAKLDPASEANLADDHLQKVMHHQREMVQALTQGGDAIAAVNGVAGAGKTYALKAAHRIWSAEGYDVIGACASWQAADVLMAESGINTRSIASQLHEWDRFADAGVDPLTDRSVVVVDEAGMVGTRDLIRIHNHVSSAGAKLVLIGDYDQLQAVGAGGLFRATYERHGVASMPYSRRQRNQVDRDVIDLIGRGQGADALDILRTEQNVVVATTGEARDQALVADWWKSFSTGHDALMLAETNRSVGELNTIARELMKAQGDLGRTKVVGPDGAEFAVGDHVVTRVNDHSNGIRNLKRWEVVSASERTRRLSLREIGGNREVVVGPSYLNRKSTQGMPALQHGYAVTGHVAQGSTHAEVFAQSGTYMQWMRTALSRAKDSMRLYAAIGEEPPAAELGPAQKTDGWAELREAMALDRAETATVDETLRAHVADQPDRALTGRLAVIETYEMSDAQEIAHLDRMVARSQSSIRDAQVELETCPPALRDRAQAELVQAQQRLASDQKARAEYRPKTDPSQVSELRAERALIMRELTKRRQMKVTAARFAPPPYLSELGSPPKDGTRLAIWIKAVDDIERFRQRYDVNDQEKSLGRPSKHAGREVERLKTSKTIEKAKQDIASRDAHSRPTPQRDVTSSVGLHR